MATSGKLYNRASSNTGFVRMADTDQTEGDRRRMEKQRRLAEALRENLKRRKLAARKGRDPAADTDANGGRG